MTLGPIVCDACVLLNLVATGQEERLLRTLGATLLTAPRARAEARFLVGPPQEAGDPQLIPANLVPLEAAGLLEVRQLSSAQLPFFEEFMRCAALIDDSDAECLALAGVLGLPLATDDRKERHLFSQLYGGKLLSTLELVFESAAALRLADEELRAMLGEIFRKGGFALPKDGSGLPLGEWYRGHLEAAGLL